MDNFTQSLSIFSMYEAVFCCLEMYIMYTVHIPMLIGAFTLCVIIFELLLYCSTTVASLEL